MTLVIECPVCNWQPDKNASWRCSCGHSWNTFETKGECPKCNTQWQTTGCPSCGSSSPHNNWYVNNKTSTTADTDEISELTGRKEKLEARLILLGIRDYKVSYLPYMDFTKEDFQNPYDVGCRLIILYAVSYSVHNLDDRPQIIGWLKKENLWDKLSNNEKDFLNVPIPDENILLDLSWKLESSLLLGWLLNLFDNIHDITIEETEEEMEIFEKNIPELGGATKDFLNNLRFRRLEEIYEETLLNELVTTYFRDLHFNSKPDETHINRMISFERHQTLNWVRRFQGIDDWDNTDTST